MVLHILYFIIVTSVKVQWSAILWSWNDLTVRYEKNISEFVIFPNVIHTVCSMYVEKILGVVKRNPLFFYSISCKNNGFLFTTPNIT